MSRATPVFSACRLIVKYISIFAALVYPYKKTLLDKSDTPSNFSEVAAVAFNKIDSNEGDTELKNVYENFIHATWYEQLQISSRLSLARRTYGTGCYLLRLLFFSNNLSSSMSQGTRVRSALRRVEKEEEGINSNEALPLSPMAQN
ncbi:hypothetical protein ElyMa_003588500 [Elysia marginata]|uniref:Uncharacterized protein n=1 Tax=Elysia marginata TaxID=1093978 RepID=A0AAV4EQ33_9GAST|nr:hypothetical protein ElyMa_003588500 [Elysia marginata]